MGYLTDKTAAVRRELRRQPLDEATLLERMASVSPPRGFAEALAGDSPAVIAEVKRASPSAGRIAEVDPVERARAYQRGGADAISVLTEEEGFGGSLADLRDVHEVTTVPVLRKDFLVHPSQLLEARANGADAVLLIAASLPAGELPEMLSRASDIGLGALVEAHSAEDLERVLATEALVIGVNARDLETLEVDERRALALLAQVPADRIVVFESGVSSREQVARAVSAGASAVLVGEALMRAEDPGAKIRALKGGR